jgi:hypothetical protein
MSQITPNPLSKYFRQPKIYLSLPSKGNYYPQGSLEVSETNEYPVFAMTAKDEMIIKTPDALLNGQATVDIIQSCIPAIKNGWAVPSLDIDAILIAIRIATYGEMMDITTKTPVTGEEKDFQVNLQLMLEQVSQGEFDGVVNFQDLSINLRPLTYKEFTEINLKTFEEQRIFALIDDDSIDDGEKLQRFTNSFAKLTDITFGSVERAITSIVVGDQEVTDRQHIAEFVSNADKSLFEAIQLHLTQQRNKFEIKPLVVDATEEEIAQGVPQSYEVPITFDSSNFFG